MQLQRRRTAPAVDFHVRRRSASARRVRQGRRTLPAGASRPGARRRESGSIALEKFLEQVVGQLGRIAGSLLRLLGEQIVGQLGGKGGRLFLLALRWFPPRPSFAPTGGSSTIRSGSSASGSSGSAAASGSTNSAAGSLLRSPSYWYCARNVSGPTVNSVSGGSGDSLIRWPATRVPLSDPKSRIINSPSASKTSQCRRLTIGWAMRQAGFPAATDHGGQLQRDSALLALPPTTISLPLDRHGTSLARFLAAPTTCAAIRIYGNLGNGA